MIISKNSWTLSFLYMSLLLLLSLLLYSEIYSNFLLTATIGGWDGTSHFAINLYYYNNIFPDVIGWVSNYYAGLPFPVFYPPLFYFFTSFVSKIFSLELIEVFKYFVIFLLLTLPLVLYQASQKITNSKSTSLIVGLISIIFLGFSDNFGGGLGVSIIATLHSGLVTQLLGVWLLFLWLPIFISNKNLNVGNHVKSIILFCLVLLSNAHVVQMLALILFPLFVYDFYHSSVRKKIIYFYIKYVGIGIGIVSFWYIPLLKYYIFSTTKTLSIDMFKSYPLWLGVFLLTFFISAIIIYRDNNNKKIGSMIYIAITLFLLLLPLSYIFPGLPLQQTRSLPILFLIMIILYSYSGVYIIEKLIFNKSLRVLFYIILIVPFSIGFVKIPNYIGSYPRQQSEEIKPIIDYLKTKTDSRSMVEVLISQIPERVNLDDIISPEDRIFRPSRGKTITEEQMLVKKEFLPDHYIIAALLGINEHQTIWTVFRESSINSIFIQPLRNSFSFGNEDFGTVCYLCEKKAKTAIKNDPIDIKLKRAELFNLGYFVVHNLSQREYFLNNINYFNEVLHTSNWSIFKAKQETKSARVLDYEPTLVFTTLKTKDRGINSYDWLRINEEWFKDGRLENFFVLGQKNIEEQTNLNNFGSIILINYKYNSLETSFSLFKSYTELGKTILLFPSNDDLYLKLKSLNSPNIIDLSITNSPEIDIPIIIDIINDRKFSIDSEIYIENSNINHEEINISIVNPHKKIVPIQISSTFFPSWYSNGGEIVYLSSPVFKLIFTSEEEVTLKFKRDRYIIITMLSLMTLLVMFLKRKKK